MQRAVKASPGAGTTHAKGFKPWKSKFGVRADPAFAHLVLPEARVTTNGRAVKVEHAKQVFEAPVKSPNGALLEVLRDPVIKDRVILVRKTGKEGSPDGEYGMYSLRRGDEMQVGRISLMGDKDYPHGGNVMSFRVGDQVRRRFGSLTPGEEKARKENRKKGFLEFGPEHARITNEPIRSKNYQGKRLGPALLTIVEQNAKSHGMNYLEAWFLKGTAARFVEKHGWTPMDVRRFSKSL